MPDPDGRRKRASLSCNLCRKRKIKCNREMPCSNCLRSRSETCDYNALEQTIPKVRRRVAQRREAGQHLVEKPAWTSTGGPTLTRNHEIPTCSPSRASSSLSHEPDPKSQHSPCAETEKLKARVKELEEQLSRSKTVPAQPTASTSNPVVGIADSHLGETMYVTYGIDSAGASQPIARNVVHKSRLLGQSHWGVHGLMLIRDIFDTFAPYLKDKDCNIASTLQKCKAVARHIKSSRVPSWPCPPSPDLPAKNVADVLLENYLQTSESIYRILHIPTLRKDYNNLWTVNPAPSTAHMVQLKLVLAIGALTNDDSFSLRTMATRWVYEAQTWVSEPKFKSRLNVFSLQTNLLLLLAQEGAGVRGDTMWIAIGALVRKSIFMGFHKDPETLPPMSVFAKEMRRRLWNTILELALRSSITSGGPPLITEDDFTTAPPGNFDEDQILFDEPIPKLESEPTQVSIAIALRKTYRQRLAVAKTLNDVSFTGTYEDTLRLDRSLRLAYRELRNSLRSLQGNCSLQFEMSIVELMLHRFLLALHVPYFTPAIQETKYAYSRKIVLESAFKIWKTVHPEPLASNRDFGSVDSNSKSGCLSRLVTCSWGFYPSVAFQAAFMIALELRLQVQEDESLSPPALRPDLLLVLDEAQDWCVRAIEAGETNAKGYILMSILKSHLEAVRLGLPREDTAKCLIDAAERAAERCLGLLETQGEKHSQSEHGHSSHDAFYATPSETTVDWNFLVSDMLLGANNLDPMSWMFAEHE